MTARATLIAQMTDIHIGFAPAEGEGELNRRRFGAALGRLLGGPNRPDMLVLSGDITDSGAPADYAAAAEMLAQCPFPVWPLVGNHDDRAALLQAFPQARSEGGFVHYAVEAGGLRLLLLDTLEEGRHGGAFCATRAAWLSAQLDAAPTTPTVIFMHHPPVVTGIDWMDPAPQEAWIARFGAVVAGRRQIAAIHCGHLHRPIQTTFHGIPLSVTASIAPRVGLDLRRVDPARPDGRDLITTEPPAYALHRWDGTALVTHHEGVSDWQVLARYTDQLQPMIHDMFGERA